MASFWKNLNNFRGEGQKWIAYLKKMCSYTINNFFVGIPKQIESNMVKTHKKYHDYRCNPVVNTFRLDPTNTEEVQYYIKTLKNKSTGPSSIPNKLFKQFKKPLSEPLTLLMKLIFSEGKFPSILKWIKSFLYAKKVAKLKQLTIDQYLYPQTSVK